MSDQPPPRGARIEAALTAKFAPLRMVVTDDSARHAGHAGAAAGGETHYSVVLVSPVFQGQGRLARSRAVHAALADEFAAGLHALALTLRAPEEEMPGSCRDMEKDFLLCQSTATVWRRSFSWIRKSTASIGRYCG